MRLGCRFWPLARWPASLREPALWGGGLGQRLGARHDASAVEGEHHHLAVGAGGWSQVVEGIHVDRGAGGQLSTGPLATGTRWPPIAWAVSANDLRVASRAARRRSWCECRSTGRLTWPTGALGVTHVVMESTSDDWKGVYWLLEVRRLECWLVNARDVQNLPGRPRPIGRMRSGWPRWPSGACVSHRWYIPARSASYGT